MFKTLEAPHSLGGQQLQSSQALFGQCFPGIHLPKRERFHFSWTYCHLGDVMVGKLSANEAKLRRASNTGRDGHSALMVHISLSGESIVSQRGVATDCKAGLMTIHSASEAHGVEISDNTETLLIQVPTETLALPEDYYGQIWDVKSPAVGLLRSFTVSLFQQDWQTEISPIEQLTFKNVIASLLRRCIDEPSNVKPTSSGQMLRYITDYVEANLFDSSLSTAKIASELTISKRSVQLAMARMGSTVNQFILDKRLTYAEAKLRDGVKRGDITAIAHETGFSDASHFIRKFKSRYGVSPVRFSQDRENTH